MREEYMERVAEVVTARDWKEEQRRRYVCQHSICKAKLTVLSRWVPHAAMLRYPKVRIPK